MECVLYASVPNIAAVGELLTRQIKGEVLNYQKIIALYYVEDYQSKHVQPAQ
jgi:hypothetical protein